jgi:hypothetical protein
MLRNQNLKHRNDMYEKNKNITREKKLLITNPQIKDVNGVYRCRCYTDLYTWVSINGPAYFE